MTTRSWGVGSGTSTGATHDPGYRVPAGNGNPGNSIETDGGAYQVAVRDSYLSGKVQWGAQTGNVRDSQFDDLWIAGSENAGILVGQRNGYTVTGHLNTIRSFGNKYGFRLDVDGSQLVKWPTVLYPSLTTSEIDATAPTGTTTGDAQLDPLAAIAQTDNPANRWRTNNPYDTWSALFALTDPSTTSLPDPSTTSLPDPSTTSEPATSTTVPQPTSTTSTTSTTSVTVPAPVSRGSDIRSYLRLRGDQVVVVPDGTYTGGNVTAPHPATGGPLKGWLVLVAQHPHGVVVDLSSGMLNLYPTTSRIMFVGFKFVNGVVKMQAVDNIRFWYCEHTFPAAEWYRQWVAAGGGHDVSQAQGLAAMNKMANSKPDALVIAQYNGVSSKRVEILGADIHDVGASGITPATATTFA